VGYVWGRVEKKDKEERKTKREEKDEWDELKKRFLFERNENGVWRSKTDGRMESSLKLRRVLLAIGHVYRSLF